MSSFQVKKGKQLGLAKTTCDQKMMVEVILMKKEKGKTW